MFILKDKITKWDFLKVEELIWFIIELKKEWENNQVCKLEGEE